MMITYLREFYIFLKNKRRGIHKNPHSLYKQLEKSQYWNRDQIENIQLKNLNDLLFNAKKNVEYYQNVKYKEFLSFKSVNSFSKNFPFITKEEIRLNFNSLINHSEKKGISHKTSGSTGKPIVIEISGLAEAYRIANRKRFYSWWKIDIFDRNVLIWNVPKEKNKFYAFYKKLENKFLGRFKLNVFDLNEETIHDIFYKIENHKPIYLRGYKSGVYELARLMEKNQLQFKKSKLKLIILTSENLFDFERNLIERVFKCKVANEYGSGDGGQFAYECPEGSIHMNEESVYISVDENKNAYVTELYNKAMPLINYRNEDRIVFSDKPCSCGRNLKVIKSIEGRVSDFIICKDGSKVFSIKLPVIFKMVEAMFQNCFNQYKVKQTGNKLEIFIIPGNGFNENAKKYLLSLLPQKICKDMEIEIHLVEQIPRDKSGKLKYFERVNGAF